MRAAPNLGRFMNAASHEFHVRAEEALPAGRLTVGLSYTPADNGHGTITLSLDERSIGSGPIPINPTLAGVQVDGAGLRLGRDEGFPVCDDYRPPFPWTGTLYSVTFDTTRPPHEEGEPLELLLRRD